MNEHVSLGVTSDFDWYELTQIKAQLESLTSRIDRVIRVIQQREQEQNDYVVFLKQRGDKLQAKLNALLEKQNAV